MASFMKLACGTAFLVLILIARRTIGEESEKLNVLFLMADQLRTDALGCYGSKIAKTPNLDWLANQGVRFNNAYTSTPSCTPARAAILTGLSPWYHGMLGHGDIPHHYDVELPSTFAANGYYTYSIGKDHFGWNKTENEGVPHGYLGTDIYDGLKEVDDYDEWFSKQLPGDDPLATGLGWNDHRGRVYIYPEYYHPTAWVGRNAIRFLESYNQSKPFFLKVSFHRPHSPYDPPRRFMDMFTPEEMPKPYLGDKWDQDCNFGGPLSNSLCCGAVGSDSIAISRQSYYGNVAFVDEWIGEIIGLLRNQSIIDKTVIIFTADHGDMLGDHYRWRKGLPYESAAKIPMLFVWPPALEKAQGGPITSKRGVTREEPVGLRDLFPTLLDATRQSVPQSLNGSSLIDLLGGADDTEWRDYIDFEHSIYCNRTFHWNGYTDGRVKYVFRAYFPNEQLFDLVNDPHEMHDLSEEPKWKDELLKWRNRLIQQFERENRGPQWVRDGRLQRRTKSQPYSPHYPGKQNECPRNQQMLPESDDKDTICMRE